MTTTTTATPTTATAATATAALSAYMAATRAAHAAAHAYRLADLVRTRADSDLVKARIAYTAAHAAL